MPTFVEDIGEYYGIEWGRLHEEYGYWHEHFINKPHWLKEKYDWFVIVRNPYERILSEYYCKHMGIGDTGVVHDKKQFNEYLLNNIKNREMSKYSYHYAEQYRYIDKNYNIIIIKFENLYYQLTELLNKYYIEY